MQTLAHYLLQVGFPCSHSHVIVTSTRMHDDVFMEEDHNDLWHHLLSEKIPRQKRYSLYVLRGIIEIE